MPCAQASKVYSATSWRAFSPSRRRSVGVVVQAVDRGAQRARVARRDDQPGVLVAHEAAGGGPYGVGRDHGDSLVEGFVDDESPRL